MHKKDSRGPGRVHAGRGVLLDVNNMCVSAIHHGFDSVNCLDLFPVERVDEIHLAGFAENRDNDRASY